MSSLSSSIMIQRPAREVFDFVRNYANDWKWRTRHLDIQPPEVNEDIEFISTRPLFPLLRYRNPGSYEITEIIPDRLIVSQISIGKISVTDRRCLHPVSDDSTRFEYILTVQLNGVLKIFQSMLQRDLSRDLLKDLLWMKELLEVMHPAIVNR